LGSQRSFQTNMSMLVDNLKARTELAAIAAETYALGLQSQRSGNLSARVDPGNHFLITRTGSKMGDLRADRDFLLAEVHGIIPSHASTEALVHQRIYQLTRHDAVLHTHPPYAIAIAIALGSIPVVYNEARAAFKRAKAIAVIDSTTTNEGGEDPTPIASALQNSEVLMIKGHGLFAAGEDFETCLYLSNLVEINAKILSVIRGYS
jgi:L-fuculose-phosphate aldolase